MCFAAFVGGRAPVLAGLEGAKLTSYGLDCKTLPGWFRKVNRLAGLVYCSTESPKNDSVLVVGGGAAGLTSAFFAAENGSNVTVIERTTESGKKILMSGGTRCNVLPVEIDVTRDYFTESSRSALRAIFSSWSLEDCKHWLEDDDQIGLDLATEIETNKYFPASNSSKEVRDKLVAACRKRGVEFRYNSSLEDMKRVDDSWECALANGDRVVSDRIVMCTGGLSFPKVGTDGTGHVILEKLGHRMNQPYPALTPLTGNHPGGEILPGVSLYSVDVSTRVSKGKSGLRRAERSGFLFTHKGYSGPSVLDLSHYVVQPIERGTPDRPRILVNWMGVGVEEWTSRIRQQKKGTLANFLQQNGLPLRLAVALCDESGVATDRRVSEIRKTELKELLRNLTEYVLPYTGHLGYKLAEVTGGGVPLKEIDCKTMESRVLPGVYLCGEIVDVFGRIGGFNFYWAWLSGRLAGLGASGAL